VALPFLIDSLPEKENQPIKLNKEHFSPLEMIDTGFDEALKGMEIKDSKGRKLGKILASENNIGVALVDLARLNQNGANHEYTVEGQRTLLWQPVWMDVTLEGDQEMTAAEQQEQAAKDRAEM